MEDEESGLLFSEPLVDVGETCVVQSAGNATIFTGRPVFWCCVMWGLESLSVPDGSVVEVMEVESGNPLDVTVRVLKSTMEELVDLVGIMNATWLRREQYEEALADEIALEAAGAAALASISSVLRGDVHKPAPPSSLPAAATSAAATAEATAAAAATAAQPSAQAARHALSPGFSPRRRGSRDRGDLERPFSLDGLKRSKSMPAGHAREEAAAAHAEADEGDDEEQRELRERAATSARPGSGSGGGNELEPRSAGHARSASAPLPEEPHEETLLPPELLAEQPRLQVPGGVLSLEDILKLEPLCQRRHVSFYNLYPLATDGMPRSLSGDVVRRLCARVTSQRFRKLRFLKPLLAVMRGVETNGHDRLTVTFDMGKAGAMEVTTPVNNKWVVESGLSVDPFRVHKLNVLRPVTTEARTFVIRDKLTFTVNSKGIAAVADGDITFKAIFKFNALVYTVHNVRRIEVDSSGRPYVRLDPTGRPIVKDGHYQPALYDDWLVISVLSKETWIGLPALT